MCPCLSRIALKIKYFPTSPIVQEQHSTFYREQVFLRVLTCGAWDTEREKEEEGKCGARGRETKKGSEVKNSGRKKYVR